MVINVHTGERGECVESPSTSHLIGALIELYRYYHLQPDDLKSAYEAIDNEGTASILSRFLHVKEKQKGSLIATP